MNVTNAILNTLQASRCKLMVARFFGKKHEEIDEFGNWIHMRKLNGQLYFIEWINSENHNEKS